MELSAVDEARLVALASSGFLAWQVAAWVVARGQWSRRRERGGSEEPPAFMARTAEVLTDVLLLAAVALPAIFGAAALLYALLWIAIPLGHAYGWWAGAAGSAATFLALAVTSIRVQQCIGRRLRSGVASRQGSAA